MEYDVNKNTLSTKDLIFKGSKEVPLDLDFSLPDYCQDIQKVLKCRICPNITSKNISSDRINIEGISKIKVIYKDAENGKIRCYENQAPFSCVIDIKSNCENAFAVANFKIEYVNCRAVSPRKLDVHGSFSICVKIYGKKNIDIFSGFDSDDIEQKMVNAKVNNLVGMGQQYFSINEVLEIKENEPIPENIINTDVKVVINDYKNMPNKTVVKGTAFIKILYVYDITSGSTNTINYSVPISQIIDVPSLTEDCKCIISSQILSHDEQISFENNEEKSNFISCEIKISTTVMAYNEKDISFVSDAYSTNYETKLVTNKIKIDRILDNYIENINHKDKLLLKNMNISKIVDIFSDKYSVDYKIENSEILFNCKLDLNILAIDENDDPIYVERSLGFVHKKSLDNNLEFLNCETEIIPTKITYSLLNSETLELNVGIEIISYIYCQHNCTMVTEVVCDESNILNKDSNSLMVYYAEKGENIWDIAKKYYTSAQMIKEENDIFEDKIDDSCMLLIPMK